MSSDAGREPSGTPRTDAFYADRFKAPDAIDFARQLERELAEAKAALAEAKECASIAIRNHAEAEDKAALARAGGERGQEWIAPTTRLPEVGQRIVFMAGSGAVFAGEYHIFRDYPTFSREDGAGSYTPKAVQGWMPLPSAPTQGGRK